MTRIDLDNYRQLTARQQARLDGWLAHHGQPTSRDSVIQEVIFGERSAVVTILKTTPGGHWYVIGAEPAVRYQRLPLPVSGLAREIEAAFGEAA